MIARTLLLSLVAAVSVLPAATVTIEPGNFANQANLSHSTAGVTLVDKLGSSDGFPSVFALDSTIDESHGRVFGWENQWIQASGWHVDSPLKAVFALPTSYVAVDFISSYDGQVGELRVFDAAGQLLNTLYTSELVANQRQRVEFNAEGGGIAFIEAGSALASIDIAQLEFDGAPVPEPSSASLLGAGAAAVLSVRRLRHARRR